MPRSTETRTTEGKKAVNLTVAVTLLQDARAQGINLSALLEDALAEALRRSRRERWLHENAAGMAAYNAQVDEHGAFADTLRSF